MIYVNLFDESFAHAATPDGVYSISDNKRPEHICYKRNNMVWNGINIFTDSYLFTDLPKSEHFKGLKVGWILETRETNPGVYREFEKYKDVFDFILTYDDELLEKYPDSTKFYPFGGCWVFRDNYGVYEKTELVSMIYSTKTITTGHKLRHEIAGKHPNISFYGSGARKPFGYKEEVLAPYMFTIVIENTKNPYYFSEKLLDSIAVGTIPIYWGASKIGDFFNEKGILSFDNLEDLNSIIGKLTPELYEKMLPYAKENLELLKKYDTPEDWIYKNVLIDYIEDKK